MMTAAENGGSGEESIVQPCPNCLKNIRLTRKLHGKRVGCKGCGAVLQVSADPWTLSIFEEPVEAPKPAEPTDSPPPPLPNDPPGGEGSPAATPGATARAAAADTAARARKAGTAAVAGAAAQLRQLKLPAKPLIIGVAGVVAVLVVGVVVATMLFGGGGDALAYVPDNSDAIASINVERIVESPIFQRMLEAENSPLKQAQEEMKSEAGMDFSDIERIVVAGNTSGSNEAFGVVEFNRAVDLEELVGQAGAEFQKIDRDGMTIYQNRWSPGMSLSLADNYTLLIGTTNQIRRVLGRTDEPKLPDKLQACIEQLDFSQAIAGAVAVPDQLPELPPDMPVPPETLKKVEAVTFQVDASSDVTVAVTLICQNSEAAEQFKKIVDGMVAMFSQGEDFPPEIREILKSLEVTHSGKNVSAQIAVGEKLINQAMAQGMPGM